jgi:integrase
VTAARAKRDEIRGRKAGGERVVRNPRLTFNGAADAWWEAQAVRLRPNTQAAYAASLVHLRHELGRVRMDEIAAADVARFVRRMEERGLKAWTIKGALTVLSRVCKYASANLGCAAPNPLDGLDKSERPRTEDRDKTIIVNGDLDRFLAAVEPEHRPMFQFAAATGARLGEVLGVRWGKVDLERGKVSITHQLDRSGRYVELKTKRSRRTIEIPPSLVSVLRKHKLASARTGDHDYVFVNRSGRPHDHRNVGGRIMSRALRRAELAEQTDADGRVVREAPTFHSLRHGHASAWIHSGGSIVELSARLGHRDPNVTMGIYAHVIEDAASGDARAARLEALYGGTLAGDAEDEDRGTKPQIAVPVDTRILPLRGYQA